MLSDTGCVLYLVLALPSYITASAALVLAAEAVPAAETTLRMSVCQVYQGKMDDRKKTKKQKTTKKMKDTMKVKGKMMKKKT